MKVGILTFHHGRNHGGYLQTLALQNVVSALGHQCVVINYVNLRHYWAELKMHWNPLRARFGYAQKWLNFSTSLRKLPQTRLLIRDIQPMNEQLDIVLIGSDEVWNYNNPLFGTDLTFFGEGLASCRKVAFAASFGSTDSTSEIPAEIETRIRELDGVSVRDLNSQTIASRIMHQDTPIILDPAFLYDFRELETHCAWQNYILIYCTGLRPSQIADVQSLARQKNLKTVSLGYYNKWCDLNIVSCDPGVWLGCFRAADSVVTTMFHGTIFAIIYERDFCTFITPYRQNKFHPMIENLRVTDRIATAERPLLDIMQYPVDFSLVRNSLNEHVNKTIEFLKMSLSETTIAR